LVKRIGGNIKDARLADELVQPIRQLLDAKFEPLHKALEGETIQLSNVAKQTIKNVVRNEPEMAKEISDLYRETGQTISKGIGSSFEHATKTRLGKGVSEVAKRTQSMRDMLKDTRYAIRQTLDYRSADKLVTRLRSLERESPQLGKLADEIEKGIDTVAKTLGKGAERAQLKQYYKEYRDVEKAAATSVTRSTLRALAKKLPKVGGLVDAGGGKVGSEEIEAANRLMRKIQGDMKSEAIRKIGQVSEMAGKAWQRIPPAYRALLSGFTESAPE
jgi:coenzyme F420-reducing hydrogenase alpha subunit